MSCGISANDVGKILRDYVQQNADKRMISAAELADSLDGYEFKPTGAARYQKLSKSDAKSIADAYHVEYAKLVEKNYFEKSKSKSGKDAEKDIFEYMRNSKILSQIDEKYINGLIDEAYSFQGRERELRMEKVNYELAKIQYQHNRNVWDNFVWVKQLISATFWFKNIITNYGRQLYRGAVSGKNIDSEIRKEITDYRKAIMKDTLKGGFPLSNYYQTEKAGKTEYEYRPEEFEASNLYFQMMAKIARFGNRINNALDSKLSYTAELVYHDVIRKKVEDLFIANGKDIKDESVQKEINREVSAKFFTLTREEAEKKAEQDFIAAGYTVNDNGKTSDSEKVISKDGSRFRAYVYETMVGGRDLEALSIAHRIAMNDYFKTRMVYEKRQTATDKIDLGISGAIATMYNGIGQAIHAATNKLPDAIESQIVLSAVGYINGAAAFSEQKLENTFYGWLKLALIKLNIDKDMSREDEIYFEIRKKDLLIKPIIGLGQAAILYGLATVLKKTICKDQAYKVDDKDILEGKSIVLCGVKIPGYLFGLNESSVAIYNYLGNEGFDPAVSSLLINMLLNGGRQEQKGLFDYAKEYISATSETQKETAKRSLDNQIINKTAGAVFDYLLPIPNRLINEATQIFTYNSEVYPLRNGFKDLPNVMKYTALQSMGLKEAVLSYEVDQPIYDYRGRKVLNSFMKFNVADGIVYDGIDELINELDVSPTALYNSRYMEVFKKNPDKKRFMTDKEYGETQRAIGVAFDEWIKNNLEKIQEFTPDSQRKIIENALRDTENASMESVEAGVDEYDGHYSRIRNAIKVDFSSDKLKRKENE